MGEEKIRPGPGGLLAPSDHEGDTGHPEHLVTGEKVALFEWIRWTVKFGLNSQIV